ncbi:hypothetical protein AB4144_06755 [Rhizobiaceae sp. 2RAB30]
MTRLFIGWKSGVGGVVKIMANDADNPLTTPNTDWWKFKFNSETAAIGYSETVSPDGSQLLPSNGYTWNAGVGGADVYYYYPAGSTVSTAKWIAMTREFTGRYYLFQNLFPNRLWPVSHRTFFPFVMQFTTSTTLTPYMERYTFRRQNYPSSSDSYVISTTATPADRICNYWNGSAWSWAVVDERDSNSVQTGTDAAASLVRSGQVGQAFEAIPFSNGPYSNASPWTVNPRTFAAYTVALPVNNVNYPTVAPGTPVSGQKMVRIERTLVKMSKPGYNVDTATDDQCIFNSDKLPMKIMKTGVVNIAAGATLSIPMGRTLAGTTFVDYQTSRVSTQAWVPPLPEDWSSEIWTQYRFSGTNLVLWNRAALAVWVRYIVMAQDDLAPSVGTAKILDANFGTGTITLRRPGSAGTRFADTILDSDLTYMPIIANDYLGIGSSTVTDDTRVGNRMWTVTWANPGNAFTPYLMMRLHVRNRANNAIQMYMPPFAKKMEQYSAYAASTFIASVEQTRARIYCNNNATAPEDARRITPPAYTIDYWDWEPIGLRYYVFALPNTL